MSTAGGNFQGMPEGLAKEILTRAIDEDRAGEFLDCLFGGGSATVDAVDGHLVLASAETLFADRNTAERNKQDTAEREEWKALAEATRLQLLPKEALIASIKYLAARLLEVTSP